jgi:hypothetical protein
MIEVRTQAELDKALKKTNGGSKELVVCLGKGRFVVEGSSSVVARGSSSVVARESSSVVARGSSSVEAYGSSSVRAFMRSQVKATMSAVVMQHSAAAKIKGGRILDMKPPASAEEWCEFHGVEIRKGGGLNRKLAGQDVAILFKALDAGFSATRGVTYEPGSTPSAPDWDGGKQECGGGLHFSPHPKMAKEFNSDPTHFVACPVLVSEIVVHPDSRYPQKVKAPRVCAPVWEVDQDGKKLASEELVTDGEAGR